MAEEKKEESTAPEIVPKWKTLGEFREITKSLADEDEMKFGCRSCGYDFAKDCIVGENGLVIEGEIPEGLVDKFEPIYRPAFTRQDATALLCAMEIYVRVMDDLINNRPVKLDGSLLNPSAGMVLQKKTMEILDRLDMIDKSKIIKPNKKIILPGGGLVP